MGIKMEQTIGPVLYWVGSIVYAFQGYFFFRLISFFLELRKPLICKLICWMLATFVCSMVIFPQDTFNITVNIPLFFLMLITGYRGRGPVKVSILLLFFPIIIGLNYLGSEISGFILFNYTSGADWINSVLSILSVLMIMLFWLVFMKIMGKSGARIIEMLDDKSWLLMDVICLASLAAVVSCVYFIPSRESYKMWFCMLACVVTNLGSIRLALYLAESIRSDMEKRNLKLQKDYYQELEANQQEIRGFCHDINNHFIVAAQLLEEGRQKEAKEYFQKLSGQLSAKGRNFCKSSIVNAVLNAKYNRATEYGIDCFFHIKIESLLFIDPIDVCTIFSNTLDNAIEACIQIDKEEERKISIKARCTDNGYFSCEVKNTKANAVQMEKGKYKTGKKEGKDHGLGIENVKEVVKRYRGTMEISHTEREFCVIILVSEGQSLV